MTTLYPGEPGDMTTLYPGEGSDDLGKMYSTPELELDRYIKGTVSVTTSGPQCKDGNTRFTTAHLKLYMSKYEVLQEIDYIFHIID